MKNVIVKVIFLYWLENPFSFDQTGSFSYLMISLAPPSVSDCGAFIRNKRDMCQSWSL